MKKKLYLIIAIIAVIASIICLCIFRAEPPIDADIIQGASAETGFISEKIIGNPDEAKLIIYEYADFSCTHCAEWNEKINALIDQYAGKIALVYRSYDLGGSKTGPIAARAATAAHIQGYFKAYKDLLFRNQAEWYYKNSYELTGLLIDYFKKASNNSGDIDKFKSDMESDTVKKRLKFEQRLGKSINLTGTPTFRINGETIPVDKLIETVTNSVQ